MAAPDILEAERWLHYIDEGSQPQKQDEYRPGQGRLQGKSLSFSGESCSFPCSCHRSQRRQQRSRRKVQQHRVVYRRPGHHVQHGKELPGIRVLLPLDLQGALSFRPQAQDILCFSVKRRLQPDGIPVLSQLRHGLYSGGDQVSSPVPDLCIYRHALGLLHSGKAEFDRIRPLCFRSPFPAVGLPNRQLQLFPPAVVRFPSHILRRKEEIPQRQKDRKSCRCNPCYYFFHHISPFFLREKFFRGS